MHRLDGYINDIEPRIMAIYENIPKQEEPSLQESLSSYGWILLDSWVAWRTLRFLLKETEINENVHSKWFQTPSSYTASQLKAVWKFSQSTLDYLYTHTGNNFKGLIDTTIQGKRNSSAHFTQNSTISGKDSLEISMIYKSLSKAFILYETASFITVVCDKLSMKGYLDFKIYYSNIDYYTLDNFVDSINSYSKSSEFSLKCYDNENRECVILFQRDGCRAGSNGHVVDKMGMKNVVNEEQSRYIFFGNKGFYRNMDLFVSTVISCWENTMEI